MHHLSSVLALVLTLGLTPPGHGENWPDFRGPTGQGIYPGKGLPTQWSPTKNVAWMEPIPGKGWSSPIVWQGRVYLTSALPIADSKDLSLTALCLDAATGKMLWSTAVFRESHATAPRIHGKNSHASPSPCTDGRRLYVHFGHQGTAALDLSGNVLWRNTEHRYAPVHGNGGSPILVDDKLVFSADGSDQQFVVALDKATGKTIWKTDRASTAIKRFSFSTPLLITAHGQKQIISPGSDAVVAYDPADGREIWRFRYQGYSVIPRPVFGHGMIFLSTSFDRPTLLAIRVDGNIGDVTKSRLAWRSAKGAPHTPSPLLVGELLFFISDNGTASCLGAKSGKVHWQQRLGGSFSASPVYADGRIYLQSEDGVTTVLAASTTFANLAQSRLGERTFASYAIADGAIFLRTESRLYRIQRQP